MKELLKKPLVRYAVLFLVFAGGLLFLKSGPLDVKVSLELDRVAIVGDRILAGVDLKIVDEEGKWVSTSAFDFPPELYPLGPNDTRTAPIVLRLVPGTYTANINLRYRYKDKPDKPEDQTVKHVLEVTSESSALLIRP